MINESLNQISEQIEKDLNSQIISGKYLLDRLCVINERSRKTSAYLDHKYAPFYYYLGKYIKPKSFLEIGFNIGLLGSCFLTSCRTVEKFFGFKEKTEEFIPTRIGKINIKKYTKNLEIYVGQLYDEYFYKRIKETWDVALINEEKNFDKQLEYIETIWPNISNNGILIIEYANSHNPSKLALKVFCERNNIKPMVFNTRYGTALISKC
jgi:predicted O-methyltransferase YrrM